MNIHDIMSQNLKERKPFVLATVIKTTGSTPRAVGAKMLIYRDGGCDGTVGGGTFEKMVIDDAGQLFTSDSNGVIKKYTFSMEGENATGMCCGGSAEVFLELHIGPARLVIFGGGHVGAALTKLAIDSEFAITVVDDRVEILEALPIAVKKIETNIEYTTNLPDIESDTFVVIVTRSHPIDYKLLKTFAHCQCQYLGMIGSKAKVAKMFKALQSEGIDKDLLDNIHAPIGVEIDAEGPYEIALSIMAQLISVKNR